MSEETEHDHDDHSSAREAFQFLALAVSAVLVVRIVFVLVQLASTGDAPDGLAEATLPYRDGYLLLSDRSLVVEHMAALPRVAAGFLFTIVGGGVIALLVALAGMVMRWNTSRAAVIGGRFGLLLCGAWSVWCLLAFPVNFTEVDDDGLVLHESSAFMDAVALPFTHTERKLTWSAIESIAARSKMQSIPCRETWEVITSMGSGTIVLAADERATQDCDVTTARQRAAAERLTAMLTKRFK